MLTILIHSGITPTVEVPNFISPVMVKQSLYRPGQALTVPGVWDSQISRKSTHEGSKVVSPTHRPPLPPQEIFLVLISVRDWVDLRTADTIGNRTRDRLRNYVLTLKRSTGSDQSFKTCWTTERYVFFRFALSFIWRFRADVHDVSLVCSLCQWFVRNNGHLNFRFQSTFCGDDWLICSWFRDLTVPMRLGLN